MEKQSIRNLELEGRALFLRVDFNVPLNEGRVSDDTRIRSSLPTLDLALERGARVILASHLGRPKGQHSEALSLRPVAAHLESLIGRPVEFVEHSVGPRVEAAAASLGNGQILLLENLRFHPGETANDRGFAQDLAGLAEEYVNDAFGTAHRAHASTVGVPSILGKGAAGLLLERELKYLSQVMSSPEQPAVAIFGGAKVSDKIAVMQHFLAFAQTLLVGGGMAFTFLKALGKEVGRSLVEEGGLVLAEELMAQASASGLQVRLPLDVVAAPRCEPGTEVRVVSVDAIPTDWMGLDIGPQTRKAFAEVIANSRTVIWNGPMGVFEIEEFSQGTLEVARAVASSDAISIVGGGDSVAAVRMAGVADDITHISTGGGAFLEFLAGRTLPGVEVLSNKG